MLNKVAFVTGWLAFGLFCALVWALVSYVIWHYEINPFAFLVCFACFCALLVCSFASSQLSKDDTY